MNLFQIAKKQEKSGDPNYLKLVDVFVGLIQNAGGATQAQGAASRIARHENVTSVFSEQQVAQAWADAQRKYRDSNKVTAGIIQQPTQTEVVANPSAPGTLTTSPTTAVIPNAAGQVSTPEVVLEDSLQPVTHLDVRAESIAKAYRALTLAVEYELGNSCDRGLRHDKYVFKKPPALLFTQLEKYTKEVLSHAGLDPNLPIIFRPLANDLFEVHIPRPESQWRNSNLLPFFRGFPKALESDQRGDFAGFFKSIRDAEPVKPWDDLKILFGVDLDGKPVYLDLTVGALFVGAPGAGKSTGIATLVEALCLTYPPEWLEIIGIDRKDGKTLKKFEAFPHFRREVITNHNCSEPERLIELFDDLRRERDRRGKKIASAGFEKIQDYNRAFPDNPIPWTVVIVEEVAAVKPFINSAEEAPAKAKKGSTLADDIFHEMLSLYRSDGIVKVGGTQYAKDQLSYGPAERMMFGSKVVYNSSVNAAAMALGENCDWAKEAPKLFYGGDCILKSNHKITRAQTLYLDHDSQRGVIDRAIRAWQHQPKRYLSAGPSLPQLPQSA